MTERQWTDADRAYADQRLLYIPATGDGKRLWDWDRLVEWMGIPANEQLLAGKYGPDWTIRNALDELATPALPNNVRASVAQRKRLREMKRNKSANDDGDETIPEMPGLSRQHVGFQHKDPDAEIEQSRRQRDNLPGGMSAEEFKAETERRLAELTQNAVDIQPWDLQLLTNMARNDILYDRWIALLPNETDAERIQQINRSLDILRKSNIEIQKALGIDRSTRKEQEAKMTDVQQTLMVMAEAGRRSIEQRIRILHCDVLVMWVRTNFREKKFRLIYECPDCGKEAEFVYTPSQADVDAATEPEFVAEEEAAYQDGDEDKDKDAPDDQVPEPDETI